MPTAQASLLVLQRRHSLPQPILPAPPPSPSPRRHGHRHTRSELPAENMPVVVRRWSPDHSAPSPAIPEHDDDANTSIPPLPRPEDFSFNGVLAGVSSKLTPAVDAIETLCTRYRESVGSEVDALLETQSTLDTRIKAADTLTTTFLLAHHSLIHSALIAATLPSTMASWD